MTEKSSNNTLKDFIFIDKDRLYSLYSQLFEGVAESMVRSVSYGTEDKQTEKKLEQSIIDASYKMQNVVLFDHIYNTFENRVKEQLLIIDDKTNVDDIETDSIIKIKGKTTIEDYEHLSYLFKNYNNIGNAIATLTLTNVDEQKAVVSKNSIEKYAKENGLYLDTKYTESLVYILENFHGNALEIIVEPQNNKQKIYFNAFLDKQFMRLSSNTIRNLYGHKPCMEWTLVGEVTNSPSSENKDSSYKNSFSDMFKCLSDVDNIFFDMKEVENKMFRVAPIALYIERTNI